MPARHPEDEARDGAIGKRMRARRRALDMSQKELGLALGVSFQQVQKYESGENGLSARKIELAATALRMPILHLMGAVEDGGNG